MFGNLYLVVLVMVICVFYECGRGFGWVGLENGGKLLFIEYLFLFIY